MPATVFATPRNMCSTTVGSSGYTAGSGVLTVVSGGGASFPPLGGGSYCRVTVIQAAQARVANAPITSYTIYKVTAVTGDLLTIGGMLEGTTDRNYVSGDVVEIRVTGGSLSDIHAAVNTIETTFAPLVSPIFTGTPQAPSPTASDSSTNLATTAFVKAQGYVTATSAPVSSFGPVGFPRTGAIVPQAGDYGVAQVTGAAPSDAPTFTTRVTMAEGANLVLGSTTGTKIGTAPTQKLGFFNQAPIAQPSGNLLAALGTTSGLGLVSGPTVAEGDVTNLVSDLAAKAPTTNPTFFGVVTLPETRILDGDNLELGTTVGTKIGTASNQMLGFFNQTPIALPSGNLLVALGTTSGQGLGLVSGPTLAVADVTGAAPLASPTFTGVVSLPATTFGVTAPLGTSTAQLATCAFVLSNAGGSGGGGVVSFGPAGSPRTGVIVTQAGDYSVAMVTGAAPLDSPTFTTKITISDGANLVLGTTTGTRIGTGTAQLLGFYNALPIAQPTGDILTALGRLGLVASPTISATRKYQTTIGDGSATTFTINQSTHGLAVDQSILVAVYDAVSNNKVYPDVAVDHNTGTVTITFATAPTLNQYRAILIG